MITDMLADVTTRGTARRAKESFKNVAIAGKTGTSRDGWFIGYTPNLVCAVWIGFDDNKQLGLTGADAALPAWIAFMKEALDLRPSFGGTSFVKPAGIITVKVDPETGQLAGPNCPATETVSVASQFAPTAECYKHAPEFAYMYDDTTEQESLERSETAESSAESVSLDADESRTSEQTSDAYLEDRYSSSLEDKRVNAALPKPRELKVQPIQLKIQPTQ